MTINDLLHKVFGPAFNLSRGFSGTGTDASGHNGLDIAAKEGTPIYAVASGRVEYARDARLDSNCSAAWACGGGNVVNINIGGDKATQYAHLSRIVVARGASVQKGQLIGYVGRTGGADKSGNTLIPGAEFVGAHVHFGLWDKNKHLMVNPVPFLQSVGASPTDKGSYNVPTDSAELGALGNIVSFPVGHILNAADVDKIINAMKAADARGSGCVAENRACFFAGQSPVAGFQGEQVVRQILTSHIGEAWDKSLQDKLQAEFGKAATEANALAGIPQALGGIADTIVKVGTYALALIILVVGLYLYGRSSDAGVPVYE